MINYVFLWDLEKYWLTIGNEHCDYKSKTFTQLMELNNDFYGIIVILT